MKKIYLFAFACFVVLSFFFYGCGGSSGGNELGGDTDVVLGAVGNNMTASGLTIGGHTYALPAIVFTSNDEGVVSANIAFNPSAITEMVDLVSLIPSSAKDSSGNIDTEVKFKITSEGVQDYFNLDQEAHTLVKYDATVGDKYELKKSDGTTITRTVTAVSTDDDFYYTPMGLYIKTITVEQDSRIPGVNKIVYRANHRFGIVYIDVVMEDGTDAATFITPEQY